MPARNTVFRLLRAWTAAAALFRAAPGPSRARREVRPTEPAGPGRHRVRVRPEAVGALSDEQLVREWRISIAALQLDWSSTDIPAVVDFRSRCLDELERRHPEGFARWMLGGPGPAGDPTPFLTRPE